jgi:hypothetical protein
LEKTKDTTTIKPIRINKGSIILWRGIPEAFKADSSLNSPMFPNVIREASSIARGRAVGTKVSEKWYRSSLSILKSRPFPASSSTYIQRNCKMRMTSTMKNVKIRGPINDLRTKLSTFFTTCLYIGAKLSDFCQLSLEEVINFGGVKKMGATARLKKIPIVYLIL